MMYRLLIDAAPIFSRKSSGSICPSLRRLVQQMAMRICRREITKTIIWLRVTVAMMTSTQTTTGSKWRKSAKWWPPMKAVLGRRVETMTFSDQEIEPEEYDAI